MGIYEYECSACNHVTEVMVPLADRKPAVDCEKCGAPAQFVVSPTPTTFRAMDRKAFKRGGR